MQEFLCINNFQDEMPSEAVALQQLFPGKGYGQNAQNKPTLEILLKNEGFEAAPVRFNLFS